MDWKDVGYRKMYTCENSVACFGQDSGVVCRLTLDPVSVQPDACAVCTRYNKADYDTLFRRGVTPMLARERVEQESVETYLDIVASCDELASMCHGHDCPVGLAPGTCQLWNKTCGEVTPFDWKRYTAKRASELIHITRLENSADAESE